jgi:hypothetical protein
MKAHVIEQGQCTTSIADQYGFFWSTVWNHSANAGLRKQRDDPNTLEPGDVLMIPDKRPRTEAVATDARHVFRMKGVPAMFRMRLLWDDKPRAGQPFRLLVDGKLTTGQTDGDGKIDVPIAPNAQGGTLTVGEGEEETVFEFNLGYLNPVEDTLGLQARLNNLGFNCGPPDGTLNQDTRAAVGMFQAKAGLDATGEPDAATRAKLVQEHGS